MTATQPHILIVVSDFPKVTETFVLANAVHYAARGHEVGVFHLKPFRHSEVVHDFAAPIIEKGVTFGWLDRASLTGLVWAMTRPRALFGAVAKMIRAHWREPKRLIASLALVPKSCAMARQAQARGVGHIHAEFAGYPATAAWLIARLTGIPFSFSAHAHDIFLSQNLLAEKARAARFVRAISHFNDRFLTALDGFPANKIKVLRCGVIVGDTVAPPRAPAADTPLHIVFVGALLPRKGVDLLLQAAARLPKGRAVLTIIGGGSQDAALRQMARDLGLENVTFQGSQPAAVVRAAMSAAHVVVVPSRETAEGRSEGIPVVIMEALSLSRPVISTRLSGIPELIEDGKTGILIDPDDLSGLVDGLTRIADNFDWAAALGAAGRVRIEQDYDIAKTAENLRQTMIEAAPK